MRAAAYARYSTDQQQHTTIVAQIRAITDYCLANNLDLIASFTDEARTGANTDRQGFSDLLAAARAHEIDAVVIYDVSRGSRDVVDWFQFRKEMMMLGIKVFSVTENLGDISKPGDFLTELVTVGMGHHNVLQNREKSIASKRVRANDGLFCGGYAPFGYQIKDGRYMVVEREAEAVRVIFEWYAAGRSYQDITAELRRMGVVGRRGQFICSNTLYFILRNERYRGVFTWFDEQVRYMHKRINKPGQDPIRIEDAIPRIITDETWERVQKRVNENTRNKTNNSRAGRSYLLSGLLHCASCGGAYCGLTTTSKGKEYQSYTCNNKKKLHTCKSKNIKLEKIDSLIVALLRDSILNGDMIEKTIDAIIESRQEHTGASQEDLRREIAALEIKKRNLLNTLESGFDSQSVRDRIGELEAQQRLLSDQQKEVAPIAEIDRDALIAKLHRDAQRLMDDPDSTRELVREYIVRIDVSDKEIIVYAIADLAIKKRPHLTLVSCERDWLPRQDSNLQHFG